MSAGVSTGRALMANVSMLLEDTGECERCHEPASVVVEIGQLEHDGNGSSRELTTCMPCALDLLVMIHRKGRLHRA